MKRIRNIYYKNLEFDIFLHCFYQVRKTCKNKRLLFLFEKNLYTNLYSILESFKKREYEFDKYNIFMIHEPKKRIVMSESVKDKIASYYISEYLLKPYLKPSLIHSNVATRKDKGSKLAYNLFEGFINNTSNKDILILRIDISKYFYSIDHKILMEKLKRKIKDKYVLELVTKLLSRTNDGYVNEVIRNLKEKNKVEEIPLYNLNKGLSIGNICSQLLAVFYLSDIDHYIKEELKEKKYIRYMDDLIIISNDLNKQKRNYIQISKKLEQENLIVNPKSKISKLKGGFTFLGYTYNIHNDKLYKRVKNVNYRRIKKKLKYLKANNVDKYNLSVISYRGYSQKLIDK